MKEYLKIFSLALTALVIIYLLIDFFEKIRRFVEYGAAPLPILFFFSLKLPMIVFQMTPLALLLATVLVLGYFSKTNEITAMKAGGISLIRMMLPLLGIGFIAGLILMIANWSFIATANHQAKMVKETQIEKKTQTAYFKQQRVWLRLDRRTFMNVQLIDPSEAVMYGISYYKLTPDFAIQEILEAKQLRFQDGQWVMVNGIHRSFGRDFAMQTDEFETHPLSLNRKPEDFQSVMLKEIGRAHV